MWLMWLVKYFSILALLCLLVWLLRPAKPALNEHLSSRTMHALFDALLYHGARGAELHVRLKDQGITLSYLKYFDSGIGIQCRFVNEGLAAPFFRQFRARLEGSQIAHTVGNPSPPEGEILTVDIGQNITMAQHLSKLLFEDVVGKNLATDCVASFNDKVLPIEIPFVTGMKRQR